jgi:hypothetical protein
MFRSTTIIGELVLSLAKVTLMLKQSVKLRRYVNMLPHHHITHNDSNIVTDCFNISATLARLKCKLPYDGRRPKHVGVTLNVSFNVNFRVF